MEIFLFYLCTYSKVEYIQKEYFKKKKGSLTEGFLAELQKSDVLIQPNFIAHFESPQPESQSPKSESGYI